MSVDDDNTDYPLANKVLDVAYEGAPTSVTFGVTPGPDYTVIKYRYNGTGDWQDYNEGTGIVYTLSSNKTSLHISVTGTGEPAVESTLFVILLTETEPPAEEEPAAEEPI